MSEGIFGIINYDRSMDSPSEMLDSKAASLKWERDNQGKCSCVFGRHYMLEMKRIINRLPSQQEEIDHDATLGTICLIHGEINNYGELGEEHSPDIGDLRGDLHLSSYIYRRYGQQFGKKLNGLFSLAILDEQASSLIILNDRFGMAHQVYWATIGTRFYFATHLKTLLALPEIKREMDPEGLNLFLKYSYIPSPWTIFKGIKKLPPGHLLVFKDGKVNVSPYWEFTHPDGISIDLEEAIGTYRKLLKKSISKRLDSNGNVGILLSGGLDSSANVALAAECANQRIKTFSVGFEDPAFDERPYAKIVSQHFNTQHFESTITGEEIEDLPKLIWHLEEPYFEFGLFLTYVGLAAAQREVGIVIGGEGADQLFGTGGFAGGRPAALYYLLSKYRLLGHARRSTRLFKNSYFYNHDNLAFKFRMLWDRAIDLNNWYFYGYDQHELLKLYRDPQLAIIPKLFPDSDSLYPRPQPPSFEDFYLQTQINQDLKHYVNENVMVKSGRMADMLVLTLRESYLDTEVTDFLTSLNFPMKRSGGLFDHLRGKIKTKYLHRKAMEGLLPPEIMNKPKQGGFVPVMIFLKNPQVRNNIYRHLLNSEIMKEYFRIDYLKNLFESYEQMQGRTIYWHNFYNSKANRILFLLTFDIWHQFYMKNNPFDITPPSLTDYLK